MEPTPVLKFRDNSVKTPIESSINDEMPHYVRPNERVLLGGLSNVNSIRTSLSSIASAVVNSFLTPTSTATSFVSAYTTTVTSTIYTATSSYTISGCIPSGVSINAC